jgi:hypothetical protein
MATGQPEQQGDFREYTSGSGSDTTSWTNPGQADWVQIIGAGSTVVMTESGNSRTITTDAAEPGAVIAGSFKAFTSTSATRVRMGRGDPPALALPVTGLASGMALSGLSAFTAETEVNGALGEIYQDLKTTRALIRLRPTDFTLADGTPLALFVAGASTVPGLFLTDSKLFSVRWNNDAAPDPIISSFHMPSDVDITQDMIVHFRASKTGATLADAATFGMSAFNQVDGALHDADVSFGGTSSAMVGNATAKTVQNVTLTLLAANLAAHPTSVTIAVQPTAGTLTTDDLCLIEVYIQYTRKPQTA